MNLACVEDVSQPCSPFFFVFQKNFYNSCPLTVLFVLSVFCFAYNRTITWSILILSWHFDTRNLLMSVKGSCIGPMSGALQDPPLSSWSVIFNSVPWCPCIIPGKWIESRQWGGKVR